MERTGVHFMFLCFVLIAFLSLVASEYKLYNSRNRLKYAGTQYVESADAAETYIHYLLNNKCKFFIVEKAIFYACPKRPTRYPFLHNEVFRLDNDHKNRGVEYSSSEKFECPFPFGTYPHPKDCRKYYLCIFDKPRIMTCESSMLYDEYKEECAKKSSVDCGDRIGGVTTKGTTPAPGQKTTSEVKTTTKKVEKFKCPYRWGTFPNPENCAHFYLCLNKKHTLKKCKPTELYDTETNECKDEDEVDCGSRFNPREKTSTTTAATTSSPTTDVTTIMEESTATIFEESTSQSSSENTSDEGATESSTSTEVSPSSELKTTLTDETESSTGEITSEEPAQFTEEPDITDDDNSETDGPQSTTEKPEIPDENTSGTSELEPSTEPPIITDGVTSGTKEPESTSENSRITDDDISDTEETELTSEESLEVTGTTSKPTEEDSSVSQDPDSKSTTSEKFSSTDNSSDHSEELVTTDEDNLSKEPHTTENIRTSETTEDETPSKESETPVAETTPSTEPRSLPDDNTVTTAEEKITPEVSQTTVDIRESSSSSSETPKSFVCPRNKGYYPHKDCSMYYVCSEGTYTIEQCPRGTLFHVSHGMCDNEDDVDCEDRTRPDRDQLSTVAYISSESPTDIPLTETVSDKDISSVGTESTTDDETFKTSTSDEVVDTSESQSTFIFSTQGISDSSSSTEDKTSAVSTENYSTGDTSESFSTADHVTKEVISSTDRENIETSLDNSSEESTSSYSTEATSETYTAVDYSTEDTSYVSYTTKDEISVESTTDFIDELSTQSTADDNEHQSTSEATEGESGDSSSTEDQSTSFISETTYSDSPATDYTDVSVSGTDVVSETHNTDNTEETTSSRTGDDEISTKNIATLTTDESSTQDTDDEETTAEEIINDLTTSELPISTKEKNTSLLPGTTQPNSDKPIVSEITMTESSETTRDYVPSSNEMTPITKVPDTTTHSPEEITVSTVQPKEICLANDNTCIVDKDGNVFRCSKSHGHQQHPWDASKFLHCDNFRIHVIDCPKGLRFDPEHGICTWAAAAKE